MKPEFFSSKPQLSFPTKPQPLSQPKPQTYKKVHKKVPMIIKHKKPNKNKGQPSAGTAQSMYKQEDIFKERINPSLGLTTDDNIELFFGLTNAQVLQLTDKDRRQKWFTIKGINRWLKRSGRMAIIYKSMPKGTILMPTKDGYPPQRMLNREANVYFRCVKYVDATGYIKKNNTIIGGIDKTNENTEDIVHKEEAEKPQRQEEKKVLAKLKPIAH
jgi:hypothetical protein